MVDQFLQISFILSSSWTIQQIFKEFLSYQFYNQKFYPFDSLNSNRNLKYITLQLFFNYISTE